MKVVLQVEKQTLLSKIEAFCHKWLIVKIFLYKNRISITKKQRIEENVEKTNPNKQLWEIQRF